MNVVWGRQQTKRKCLLTGFNLILEGGGAVIDERLQRQSLFGDSQIQKLLHLLRMMEFQYFDIAIVYVFYEIKEDFGEFLEEFFSDFYILISHFIRKKIWK